MLPLPRYRDAMLRHLRRSAHTANLLELAGTHTLADRADKARSGGDITAVRLPPAPGAWRTTRVKAWRRGGTDQCVEAFHQAGWWGYERPLPDVLLGWLRHAPGTMFDVGANTGVYSLIAATVPGATVHAFEALPQVAALARENLALNRVGRRVQLIEAAVSDTPGEVKLYVPESQGLVETSASLNPDFRNDGGSGTPVVVPATTLDQHWDDAGRPTVTLVKIDVEGVEHLVFRGADRLLADARPTVFYEVLPAARMDELEDIRAHHRYVDVRLSQWEAVVNDRIQFHELAWNHALVPFEALDAFLDVTAKAGLTITVLD